MGNVNSEQAVSVIEGVNARFPDHGGAFLWAASDDNGWSGPVAETLALISSTPTSPTSPTPVLPSGNSCTGEPCNDASHCRSRWGYCGSSADYCNTESTWTANGCSVIVPSAFAQRPSTGQLKLARRHGTRSGNVLMQWATNFTADAKEHVQPSVVGLEEL